ncbi:MAG: RsmD family RNA methyltransferase [Bacteroidia bacterium]
MRIIGGHYKGFRFDPPSKIPARPTTDRAKESLINILLSNFGIEDKKCLDLFSGTGNIAYELASQGAESVTVVDVNFNSVDYIKQTFEKLGYPNFKIIKTDIFKWLKQNQTNQYELIFADPPYDHIGMSQLPELIFSTNLLTANGILIIEHRTSLAFQNPHLKYYRDYGQSRFSFFEW